MKIKKLINLFLIPILTSCNFNKTSENNSSSENESTPISESSLSDEDSSLSSENELSTSLKDVSISEANNIQYPFDITSTNRVERVFESWRTFQLFKFYNFSETNPEMYYYLFYDKDRMAQYQIYDGNPRCSIEYEKNCACTDKECLCKGDKYKNPVLKAEQAIIGSDFLVGPADFGEGYLIGFHIWATFFPTAPISVSQLKFSSDTSTKKLYIQTPDNELVCEIYIEYSERLNVDPFVFMANYFLDYAVYM